MSVVGSLISSQVVDKLGRKILLLLSIVSMCVSLIALGVFFHLKDSEGEEAVESLGWLPLTSLSINVVMFALGFGPIPWM